MPPACEVSDILISNASSYIMNNYICASFHLTLAVPTILLNASLIAAILMSSERGESYQILVLNLAFTDLAAAVFSMPGNFAIYLYTTSLKSPCVFANTVIAVQYLVGFASVSTVILLALERYVFIFHPYFYNKRMTSQNVAALSIVTWLLASLVVLGQHFAPDQKYVNGMNIFMTVFTSVIITFAYSRIFLRARKIRQQIEAEEVRFHQQKRSEKDKNILLVGGLIVISFFVCFSLIFILSVVHAFGTPTSSFGYLLCWSWLFVMGNSMVNPIISCTFNPNVRQRIKQIVCCKRNEGV